MASNLTRRDFLYYGGATVAGITLGEAGRRQLGRADDRANVWPARTPERWATSVCQACPAACGVRARLVNDVPVKLEGNPLCPIGRGRLCAKGQAALEAYFDPDRLVGPARRTGADRTGGWTPIGWDEATALLAARLRSAAARPADVLALAAEAYGPLPDIWTRFWKSAGAQLLWTPAATAARLRDAFCSLTGVDADPVFDLEHATHVLSFGAPIVEDWLSPVWAQRSYGRFRRGSPQARGRMVHIDMRRSMTARKADEWIAVPADRQAALAYGLAAVLLREGRTTGGLVDAASGNVQEFERTVAAHYQADQVAAATGVPVVTLLRLARDLVASPRPLVAVGTDGDPALLDAVVALNALIGAFDRPGGIFAAAPTAMRGADRTQPAEGDLRSARVVALRDASMLRSLSTPAFLFETVERAEFVVSFSPYLDEAAQAADLLLPVHTPLESWHAVVPPAVGGGEQIALARPAAAARLDTRDPGELLKAIATATGGALAAACDWTTSADVVQAEVARLGRERRGTPYVTPFGTEWIKQLEHGGWWIPATPEPEAFAAAVLDAGGWLDPAFEPGEIRRTMEAQGGPSMGLAPAGVPQEENRHERQSAEYPLTASAFVPAVVDLLGSQNQPALFELLGQPEGSPWQPWVEVNPDTARLLGLETGSRVRVRSAYGTLDVLALLTEGIRIDAVAVAHVPVVPRGGRWARTAEADVRRLWPRGRSAIGVVPVRLMKV